MMVLPVFSPNLMTHTYNSDARGEVLAQQLCLIQSHRLSIW